MKFKIFLTSLFVLPFLVYLQFENGAAQGESFSVDLKESNTKESLLNQDPVLKKTLSLSKKQTASASVRHFKSLEVLEFRKLTPEEFALAKKEIKLLLSEGDLGLVFKNLPNLVHFEMTADEKLELMRSFCRFKGYGFELLKVVVNKNTSFQKSSLSLMKSCERQV